MGFEAAIASAIILAGADAVLSNQERQDQKGAAGRAERQNEEIARRQAGSTPGTTSKEKSAAGERETNKSAIRRAILTGQKKAQPVGGQGGRTLLG